MSFIGVRRGLLVLASLAWLAVAPASAQDACGNAHTDSKMLRMRGTLLDAREKLLICAQSECPKLISKDCTLWLSEVDATLSSVVFAVTDDRANDLVEVEITANGHALTRQADGRALALDPGAYQFRFTAAGFAPGSTSVTVRASEKNRIVRVQLQPAAPASGVSSPADEGGGVPVLTYVLGGVGLAGFGAFAGFGLAGQSQYDSLKDSCAPRCSESERAGGKRLYVLANVGLGLGLAAAAAAVVSYFVLSEPGAQANQARLEAGLLERGAYLSYTGRY